MKKTLAAVLLLLLLAAVCTGASANSWGLSGKLYQAVERSKAWEDYSILGKQQGPFAVMKSRYHYALFYVDPQEQLHVYTTAVWQPEDGKERPELYWDGHYLSIAYGDDEQYTFCEWEENSGEYRLSDVRLNGFYMTGDPGTGSGYAAADNVYSDAIALEQGITLSGFNIRLLPHSVEEVQHVNYMQARFDSGLGILNAIAESVGTYNRDNPGELLQPKKKGTAAVYSAPYGESAWRAGKGKAAVGLNGDLWVLCRYRNEDNRSYACIRYDVSERTQRIGYALCKDLGLPEITEQNTHPGYSFVKIDVEATADTFLTDDPDVSQYPQFDVPKGTQFRCLGLYNSYYAYVAAETKDGRFTDGGAVTWGFVPVRDLKPMEQDRLPDAADLFSGTWLLEAGGSIAQDILRLEPDGTFTTDSGYEEVAPAGANTGTWYVTKYNPAMNLYPYEVPYEITLLYDNGRAAVFGLEIDMNGFTLMSWQGSALYIPYDGTFDPDADHG